MAARQDPLSSPPQAELRIDNSDIRQWFVDVIRARAQDGQQFSRQAKVDLLKQEALIDSKLQTLLDLRMENEIGTEEYAAKRAELHERQSAIGLQLEVSDRDTDDVSMDACGLARLASRTVGVPFVGLIAGCLVISELLRRLHGGAPLEVASLSAASNDSVECVPHKEVSPYSFGHVARKPR
jgi:hypothetical protein